MKKYFTLLIIISLVFLSITLYKADYLEIPKIYSPLHVVLGVLILFVGFLFDGYAWKKTLEVKGMHTKSFDAIKSMALSVFAKYIPGKIWVIVGRSSYIAKKYNFSEKDTGTISVITQVISLWIGVLFGISSLFFVGEFRRIKFISLSVWLILTLVLFTPYMNKAVKKGLTIFTKKEIIIPHLVAKEILIVIPWHIIRWLLFCTAFYYFTSGITNFNVAYSSGLIYALAGSLGLMVFFIPGGIGVREGIVSAYLVLTGVPIETATAIGISSRLWYLAGEVIFFTFGLIKNRK